MSLPKPAKQIVSQAVFEIGRPCSRAEILRHIGDQLTPYSGSSALKRLVADGILENPEYNRYYTNSPIKPPTYSRTGAVLDAVKAICSHKETASAADIFDFFGYPNQAPAQFWLEWRGTKARSAVNDVLQRLCRAGKIERRARSQYIIL